MCYIAKTVAKIREGRERERRKEGKNEKKKEKYMSSINHFYCVSLSFFFRRRFSTLIFPRHNRKLPVKKEEKDGDSKGLLSSSSISVLCSSFPILSLHFHPLRERKQESEIATLGGGTKKRRSYDPASHFRYIRFLCASLSNFNSILLWWQHTKKDEEANTYVMPAGRLSRNSGDEHFLSRYFSSIFGK